MLVVAAFSSSPNVTSHRPVCIIYALDCTTKAQFRKTNCVHSLDMGPWKLIDIFASESFHRSSSTDPYMFMPNVGRTQSQVAVVVDEVLHGRMTYSNPMIHSHHMLPVKSVVTLIVKSGPQLPPLELNSGKITQQKFRQQMARLSTYACGELNMATGPSVASTCLKSNW